jgi:hypothetical protein
LITDSCSNTIEQKCNTEGVRKEIKIQKFSIEIQGMWNMKCLVILVIIGATGTVTKGLKQYLETIPGKHSINSLHKAAVLGTSHIIRKVLQSET